MNEQPAFPLDIIYTQENERFNGMTLRDYFAARAMQAMLARTPWDESGVSYAQLTGSAYQMADAMMLSREL
jgi:hypothetical protein